MDCFVAVHFFGLPIHSSLHRHAQNQPAELSVAAAQRSVLLMWVEVPDSSHS